MAIIDDEYIDAVIENRKKAAEQNRKRIAANEAKGFILVHGGDGWEIYKKKNEVGGWIYYSDKYSNLGSLPIFDSVALDKDEFIAIAKDLYGLEFNSSNTSIPPPPSLPLPE